MEERDTFKVRQKINDDLLFFSSVMVISSVFWFCIFYIGRYSWYGAIMRNPVNTNIMTSAFSTITTTGFLFLKILILFCSVLYFCITLII